MKRALVPPDASVCNTSYPSPGTLHCLAGHARCQKASSWVSTGFAGSGDVENRRSKALLTGAIVIRVSPSPSESVSACRHHRLQTQVTTLDMHDAHSRQITRRSESWLQAEVSCTQPWYWRLLTGQRNVRSARWGVTISARSVAHILLQLHWKNSRTRRLVCSPSTPL
jgi:hypothetical protein